MSEQGPLLGPLQEADRALAEEALAPTAVHRISRRMAEELSQQETRVRRRWVPMLTFVAGAALVMIVLAWGSRDSSPPGEETAEAGTPVAVTFTASGPDCRHEGEQTIVFHGACDVSVAGPRLEVRTLESSEVAMTGSWLDVRSGSALFDVDPVRPDHGEAPVRIKVPGGEFVVVGTRFRIQVSGDRGQVDLYEGRLRFEGADGTQHTIDAGQRFEFATSARGPTAADQVPDTEPDPEPEPEPALVPEPVPEAKSPARPSPATVIEKVTALRARGQYAQAAAELRTALRTKWDRRTAEVLSYELGTILTRHLDDSAKACAHWAKHKRRFRAGRYASDVERAEQRLGCE